eukprot:7119563-Prymnesium_polylepis.2
MSPRPVAQASLGEAAACGRRKPRPSPDLHATATATAQPPIHRAHTSAAAHPRSHDRPRSRRTAAHLQGGLRTPAQIAECE